MLAMVQLINRSGTMVLPFFAIYLKTQRGFRTEDVGTMLAIFGLGAVVGNLLGGLLTNRLGAIRIQIVALILAGLGMLALWVARTQWQIAACFFFVSLTAEAIRPASATAITYFVPPELHSRAFVVNRLAINVGWSIGPALGGFLAGFGYRYLFLVDAATCMLAGGYVLWVFGWRYEAPPLDESPTPELPVARSPWVDVEFLISLFLQFLIALVFFQMHGTLSLYFKECLGLNEFRIGLLFAVNTVVIVFTEMQLMRALEHVSRLRLLAWGTLLTGWGFGLLPFSTGVGFVAFTILVWTLGEMLSSSPALVYTSGRATRANRGAYFGLHSMCFAAASIVAPVIGTRIYEVEPAWLWYSCAAVGCVTWTGFRVLDAVNAASVTRQRVPERV